MLNFWQGPIEFDVHRLYNHSESLLRCEGELLLVLLICHRTNQPVDFLFYFLISFLVTVSYPDWACFLSCTCQQWEIHYECASCMLQLQNFKICKLSDVLPYLFITSMLEFCAVVAICFTFFFNYIWRLQMLMNADSCLCFRKSMMLLVH
jgi:hypothetical protein